MFLQIVGFGAVIIVLLYLTIMWLVWAWDGMGKYNIGGVPNSVSGKFLIIVALAVLLFLWYYTFAELSPFGIITKIDVITH